MHGSAQFLLAPDEAGVNRAVELLAAGDIVAAPTDTVYGIAARIDRPDALRRLFLAKGRPSAKAIPILLSDAYVAAQVARDAEAFVSLASVFWPGALTIVTESRAGLPSEVETLNEHGVATVALRLPDSAIMRTLCRLSEGVLAVTSANASGQPPATRAALVVSAHLPYVAAVLDGGETPGPLPSTIVSVNGKKLEILREGVIPGSQVARVWRDVNGMPETRGMISG